MQQLVAMGHSAARRLRDDHLSSQGSSAGKRNSSPPEHSSVRPVKRQTKATTITQAQMDATEKAYFNLRVSRLNDPDLPPAWSALVDTDKELLTKAWTEDQSCLGDSGTFASAENRPNKFEALATQIGMATNQGNYEIQKFEERISKLKEQALIDRLNELLETAKGDPDAQIPNHEERLRGCASVSKLKKCLDFYIKLEAAANGYPELSTTPEEPDKPSSARFLNNLFEELIPEEDRPSTFSQRSAPDSEIHDRFLDIIEDLAGKKNLAFTCEEIERLTTISDERPGIKLNPVRPATSLSDEADNPFAPMKDKVGWTGLYHRYNQLTSRENKQEIDTLFAQRSEDFTNDGPPKQFIFATLNLAEQMEPSTLGGKATSVKSWMMGLLANAIGLEANELPRPADVTVTQRNDMVAALKNNHIIAKCGFHRTLSFIYPFIDTLTGFDFADRSWGKPDEQDDNPFKGTRSSDAKLRSDFNTLQYPENKEDATTLWESRNTSSRGRVKDRSKGEPGIAHRRSMDLMLTIEKRENKSLRAWMNELIDEALGTQIWHYEADLSADQLKQQQGKQRKAIGQALKEHPAVGSLDLGKSTSDLYPIIEIATGRWLGTKKSDSTAPEPRTSQQSGQ